MKRITLIAIALLALFGLPSLAHAQNMLAGKSLHLYQQSTLPSNLSGNMGIYNLNGVLISHQAGVDQTVLSCSTCTTNVLPYFDTLSGNTAKPSAWFYNSASDQFCGGGASNPYCVRLDNGNGVASIGYDIGIADGNYIQNDTVGTKIYHAGSVLTQTLTVGGTETLRTAGVVESTTGGFKFPDATIQTSAATNTANSLFVDPAGMVTTTTANCGGGHTKNSEVYESLSNTVTAPTMRTTSNAFMLTSAGHITGGVFWTEATSVTMTVALWEAGNNNTTASATCTVAVTTAGKYSCTFASPVASVVGGSWAISVFSGNQVYTTIANCSTGAYYNNPPPVASISTAVIGGPNLLWTGSFFADSTTGIAKPSSGGAAYPISPTFTIP